MEEDFHRNFFINEALKEANKAFDDDEVPIGAVIVANNRVIARGYNQVEKLHDVTAHAEMIAITSAANHLSNKYLTGCSIYITLEPCPMCAAAIAWSRIEHVYYGAKDLKKGYSLFSEKLIPEKVTTLDLHNNECLKILQDFFRSKRKGKE